MMLYDSIKPYLLTIFLIGVILYLLYAYWSCQQSYKHVCSKTKSDTSTPKQTLDTSNDTTPAPSFTSS